MTAIRKRLPDFLAIVALVVVAAIVGGYVLSKQRLRFPFLEEEQLTLKAELQTAQAVVPGQGQTIRVYGVKVGDIGRVRLEEGRAVVEMKIDPEYKDLIKTDASALLRPKTGLKDMFLEVDPGGGAGVQVAKEGFTIPVSNTLPDVNPDEILAVLDEDTRAYIKLLIADAGKGLKGRGGELREIFRRFEPTHRDLARVTSAVAVRRQYLSRLIASLNRLTGELASKDSDLSALVENSATVFRAFASEDANVSATVAELPPALRETTRTLGKVESFARLLGPTAERLRPAVRALERNNASVRPFAREATPIVRDQIRPFVRDLRPLVRDLRPAAMNIAAATPDLTRSFVVLNNLFNMIGLNPNGREDPSNAARQEGYLFSIAWLTHQSLNLFSSSDAHGVFRPTTLGGTCNTFRSILSEAPPQLRPVLELAYNLTPVLTTSGGGGGGGLCG